MADVLLAVPEGLELIENVHELKLIAYPTYVEKVRWHNNNANKVFNEIENYSPLIFF